MLCYCREPTADRRQSLIKIPELKISKLHAIIFYDKHEKSFMVKDLGSVNGTFLNKDQRLCEVCVCVCVGESPSDYLHATPDTSKAKF